MPRRHSLIAVTALLAAAAAVPASARVPHLTELTATTVVTASSSGWVDVVVPVDARLSASYEGNRDVAVEGTGRFVGLWLLRDGQAYDGDGLTVLRLPAFLGGRVSTSGSYAPAQTCKGTPEALPLSYDCTGGPAPTSIVLHEGRYRLLVLADGHPLRFTLRLHGLDAGTTEVSPTKAVRSQEKALPARDGVGSQLVTFGATAPFGTSTSAWVMATAKGTTDPTFSGHSSCARQDDGTPPPLAYGPHCPNGLAGGYREDVRVAGQQYGFLGAFVSTGDSTAPLGLGGSVNDSGGVTLGDTLGVWLDYVGV